MTAKLKAHIENGRIILDESLPEGFSEGSLVVYLEQTDFSKTSPDEIIQSSSGFAQNVLLNTEEDVWEND